jgi:hypothetical protein
METVIEINGRRATVVTSDEAAQSAVTSSSNAISSSSTSASTKKKNVAGAYHCSLCDAYFWDSAAVATHRASRRHRESTGELARERMKYKPDAEVTVEDVMELVERKRLEKISSLTLTEERPVSLSSLLASVGAGKRPRGDTVNS